MTTRTSTRTPRTRRLRQLAHSDALPVAIAAVVALAVGLTFLRGPATVDAVSVTNPSDYHIAVEVRGGDGGWMPMTTVRRHDTTSVRDVIDQGDTWTFRLRAQGRSAGEYSVGRDALAAAGWTFEIPPDAGELLRDSGAPVPP